jgi:hypothetical protein
MAIEQNDGVLTKSQKPTDIKTYVGDIVQFEFNTKESIPETYRHPGMIVHEYLNGNWKDYKWNEITNSYEPLLNLSGTSLNIVEFKHVVTIADELATTTKIDLPIEYKLNNTTVSINGISLASDNDLTYKMYDVEIIPYRGGEPYFVTRLEFQFPLEIDDIVIVLKY